MTNAQIAAFKLKHHSQLVGKTIKGLVHNYSMGEVFIGLEFTDGTIAWINCDRERNGPGWLAIEPGKPASVNQANPVLMEACRAIEEANEEIRSCENPEKLDKISNAKYIQRRFSKLTELQRGIISYMLVAEYARSVGRC